MEFIDTSNNDWFVVWTMSRHEQKVCNKLEEKSFEVFLPKVTVWSRRKDRRKKIEVPLFPGYLFLRSFYERETYLEVIKVDGVVKILGESWEHPGKVPEKQINDINVILRSGTEVLAHPFIQVGRKVRVIWGPLLGVEGILTEIKSSKSRLVISVELVGRSIAVEIDSTWVEPC
ncbi:MAG: UpxY family transcription antiterminator [Candidatus Tectomicrobia bacterium]|uniref:Transcription termination/antitermination protein NusG n=1 Tax=Tectimicrobiota bacterium TaxID=2528274 RepID=A0A933GLN9_UNCTE|nr:UpxY family transcription antiterminator [Candidatus Tectomicrobia bacterium]